MIVAMVSGGVDSVVLLDVLRHEELTVLHVDHGLRPDSGDDAEFVRGLHPSVIVRRLDAPRGNTQAWARDERYRLAGELGEVIATGHTASDQVEGTLLRLASSPGRRALLGMREREGRLWRPLLGWTRDEVVAYARERGLVWREDPSNASPAYARNRARADLVPALKALHPAAEANVLRTLDLLRDEAVVLDDVVRSVLDGEDGIGVDRLAALSPALARLVLQALADGASTEAPAVGAHLPAVLALRDGTKALDLGGGLRAVVSYGRLTVRRADPAGGGQPDARPLAVPGSTPFLTGAVDAEPVPLDGPRHPDVIDPHGRSLVVRPRRTGDRIAPLGMAGHTKSLQDLFVDRKVPAPERDRWPVVCAGEEVVWIPGVATSERARVTHATVQAVGLRWDRVRS